MPEVRILFLADTHIGCELPDRPRVQRRRRGHDFLDNYQRALSPALDGDVDLVVHGGDVFDRPRVSPAIGYQAFEPLRRIADGGIPIVIVPGNHERSRLPHARLARHPNIHVFDRACSVVFDVAGVRILLAGFPYQRHNVRGEFVGLLAQTEWDRTPADMRLLCVHHCIEGATVGPQNFTFRGASDVIRINDVPAGFSAVLSGHIHRHQVLTRDLCGRAVAVPVFYPGSTERTAAAELGEDKGFLVLRVGAGKPSGPIVTWQFHQLPTRPFPERRYRSTVPFRRRERPVETGKSITIDLFDVHR